MKKALLLSVVSVLAISTPAQSAPSRVTPVKIAAKADFETETFILKYGTLILRLKCEQRVKVEDPNYDPADVASLIVYSTVDGMAAMPAELPAPSSEPESGTPPNGVTFETYEAGVRVTLSRTVSPAGASQIATVNGGGAMDPNGYTLVIDRLILGVGGQLIGPGSRPVPDCFALGTATQFKVDFED